MHIALISAHYPPNFVSGGTLVPQRLARGLVSRGHAVSVFAGRLDADEAPLTESDTVDDHGVAVHWINVTPWTAWDDPRNVDNPPVSAAFGRWLDEVHPDVVHAHSLQAVGAGLLAAAAARGVPVVVTMHDFWWICARQFLVDRDYHPCALVVAAGVCGCQAGRAALDARAATLAPYLDAVDLVLTPSAVTRDVLVANGLDPDRVEVDENGLDLGGAAEPDRSTVRRANRSADAPVRLRYTGGPDPMKGIDVLRRAAAAAADTEGWELIVHLPTGESAGADLDRLVARDRVTVAPPYPPERLDEIMADTDVLVLPSVMRETHSIVTREAMLRGVPVIASDSLGPEEVIDDGVNGIMVPSDDATALAEAIRRVATVDGLVDRLRARAPEIPIRAIDDQVVGVEAHLRRVVTTADGGARQATIDTRWHHVAYVVGIEGAPLRYRAQFPAEALESLGVRTTVLHYNDPRLDAVLAEADAAIFYRVPATDRVLAAIDATRRRGAPTVFDVDDLIVDPGVEESIPALRMLPRDEADLWRRGIHRYRTTLEHCDAYSGSTTPLVDHVGRVVGIPAFVKDNHYGLHLARASDAALRSPRDPGPVRIGYFSGTTTHDEDLHFVTPALVSVLAAHPDVELWLGGHLPVVDALAPFADRVRRLPFVAWNELPALLRQIDINLAPLADDDVFNQSKSAIKWLEAALVATPTIATPTPPFADAITDGVTGVLAATPDAWGDALDSLVGDEARRRSLGARARRAALLEWSPAHAGRRVLAILDAAAAAPSRRSTWLDVTDPEPALASPPALTAYPPVEAGPGAFDLGVDGPVTPRGRRARARWVVSELRRRPARESMAAVARRLRRETGRAVRALRRRLG